MGRAAGSLAAHGLRRRRAQRAKQASGALPEALAAPALHSAPGPRLPACPPMQPPTWTLWGPPPSSACGVHQRPDTHNHHAVCIRGLAHSHTPAWHTPTWILWGPGLPPEITGDSVGSTAMTWRGRRARQGRAERALSERGVASAVGGDSAGSAAMACRWAAAGRAQCARGGANSRERRVGGPSSDHAVQPMRACCVSLAWPSPRSTLPHRVPAPPPSAARRRSHCSCAANPSTPQC